VKELNVNLYAHNFLTVFRGTPLWITHDKYGIRCAIDKTGIPETTDYAYDLKTLKPVTKCSLEADAHQIRLLATHALYDCDAPTAGKGIGTVIIEADALSPEIAEWLRGILRVGGIVVQIYPAMKRSTRWQRLVRDRTILGEHLVPALRYIQVQPKKKNTKHSDDVSWDIASAGVDVYRTHKPGLLSIRTATCARPLIAWTRGQEPKANVCEISGYLRQPDQLVHLMDQIEAEDSPSSLQRMPIPPNVKYSGRWLRGKRPCFWLTRLEVSSCGEVRCCRQGQPIGKVGDSRKILSKRLVDVANAVEHRRGCAECQNRHCPRCPFPGIDDRTYCQIMSKQERALQLLDWIRLYSRLPLLLALPRVS